MNSSTDSSVRLTRRRAQALKKKLMRDFVNDVEDLLDKVVDVPDADVATVRKKVADAIAGAREAVESGAISVRDSARVGANVAHGYLQEYPWAALGIAFGVGVLVGLSSRR